jgi:phosphoesterase RecJ-like protein
MEFAEKIGESSHIVLLVDDTADSIGAAGAFYTYLMRLHKKTTLYTPHGELPQNLSFLPWFEKIKKSFPPSADCVVTFTNGAQKRELPSCQRVLRVSNRFGDTPFTSLDLIDLNCISITQVVFGFFTLHGVKINQKMATALYAGLLEASKNFTDERVDGTTFALASQWIQSGAEHRKCLENTVLFRTLASLRLKALLLQKMRFVHQGTLAWLGVSKRDLLQSGANENECLAVLEEVLWCATLQGSFLLFCEEGRCAKVVLRSKKAMEFPPPSHAKVIEAGSYSATWQLQEHLQEEELIQKIITIFQKEEN